MTHTNFALNTCKATESKLFGVGVIMLEKLDKIESVDIDPHI